MRLTAMTDFALRLLMYLAQQQQQQQQQQSEGTRERLCTIAEIARFHEISEAHLMKVTHQLGVQGFIETVRGKGGGLRLARPPAQIGLGEVVHAMEADFRIAECFGSGNACVLSGTCRLATVLDGALDAFWRHIDGFTLADIVPAGAAQARPGSIIAGHDDAGVSHRIEWLGKR